MLGFAGDRYAAKRQGSLSVERCPVPLLRYQSHWTRLLKASPVFGKKDGIPSRSCGPSHPFPWSPRREVLAAARAPKAVSFHGRRRRQRFGRPFARKQPRRMFAKNMTGSNELSVIFALKASRQLQPYHRLWYPTSAFSVSTTCSRLPSRVGIELKETPLVPTGGVSFCIPETRTAHPKVDRCALWRYSATPFLLDLNSVYSSARMAWSSSSISLVTAARFSRSTPRRLLR